MIYFLIRFKFKKCNFLIFRLNDSLANLVDFMGEIAAKQHLMMKRDERLSVDLGNKFNWKELSVMFWLLINWFLITITILLLLITFIIYSIKIISDNLTFHRRPPRKSHLPEEMPHLGNVGRITRRLEVADSVGLLHT